MNDMLFAKAQLVIYVKRKRLSKFDYGTINKALDFGKELENENLMLKTKLAMYEELTNLYKEQDDFTRVEDFDADIKYVDEVLNKIEELLNQIKSLDKKCDGECGI